MEPQTEGGRKGRGVWRDRGIGGRGCRGKRKEKRVEGRKENIEGNR